jgi:hypothetical protein
MRNLAVFDMAAGLHHLKPANLAQRARGAADAVLNRVLEVQRAQSIAVSARHQTGALRSASAAVGW